MIATDTRAVVTVGDGRGFIVKLNRRRLVITAAHCLPELPPAHAASYTHERTYKELLAPLGTKPKVWAECLFADPIADLAILGAIDMDDFPDEMIAYRALTQDVHPFKIGKAPRPRRKRLPFNIGTDAKPYYPCELIPSRADARVLTLAGRWAPISFDCSGPWLLADTAPQVAPGMSGSPIVFNGYAIGALSTGSINPVLTEALPGRFLPL